MGSRRNILSLSFMRVISLWIKANQWENGFDITNGIKTPLGNLMFSYRVFTKQKVDESLIKNKLKKDQTGIDLPALELGGMLSATIIKANHLVSKSQRSKLRYRDKTYIHCGQLRREQIQFRRILLILKVFHCKQIILDKDHCSFLSSISNR